MTGRARTTAQGPVGRKSRRAEDTPLANAMSAPDLSRAVAAITQGLDPLRAP
jgi:hypothetical protein